MHVRTTPATFLCSLAILTTAPAAAQSTPADVTFEMPLNLTRLASQFTKISVRCDIHSVGITGADLGALSGGVKHGGMPGRTGETQISPSRGQVVQTVRVVVPFAEADLDDPSGKAASYECRLFAFDQSLQYWLDLWDSKNTTVNAQLTPNPTPITGTFVW